jgi:serine protease Do
MAGVRGVGVAALGVLLLGAGSASAAGSGSDRLWVEAASAQVQRERGALSEVARRAMPAVVSITTQPSAQQAAAGGGEAQQGIGSGFVIHPDGYILTAAHVVEGAAEVRVTLLHPEGYPEEVPARVLGIDGRTDSALLKVRLGRKLPVLPLGSGQDVQVADWVVVIGNPFGLSHTVSVGVVSYQGRTDVTPAGRDGDFDYLQTDASINPGNSGGPVLDLQGNVVAMANAVNVSGQGIGFAIPIDIAKAVVPHLKRYGQVKRGWLGVAVQDLTPALGVSLGIRDTHGVVVSDVTEGSPGARAGLRVGDVVTELDAAPVARAHVLRWRVSTRGAGRTVELAVRRHGRPLKLKVQLEAMEPLEPETITASAPGVGSGAGGSGSGGSGAGGSGAVAGAGRATPLALFGATLQGEEAAGGARVDHVEPGSPFFDAGLLPGDVVQDVDGRAVGGGTALADVLGGAPGGATLHLSVRRGAQLLDLPFRKP